MRSAILAALACSAPYVARADTPPFMRTAETMQLTVTSTPQSWLVNQGSAKQVRIVNETLCIVRVRAETDASSQVSATTGVPFMPGATEIISLHPASYVSAMLVPSYLAPSGCTSGMIELTYGGGQ